MFQRVVVVLISLSLVSFSQGSHFTPIREKPSDLALSTTSALLEAETSFNQPILRSASIGVREWGKSYALQASAIGVGSLYFFLAHSPRLALAMAFILGAFLGEKNNYVPNGFQAFIEAHNSDGGFSSSDLGIAPEEKDLWVENINRFAPLGLHFEVTPGQDWIYFEPAVNYYARVAELEAGTLTEEKFLFHLHVELPRSLDEAELQKRVDETIAVLNRQLRVPYFFKRDHSLVHVNPVDMERLHFQVALQTAHTAKSLKGIKDSIDSIREHLKSEASFNQKEIEDLKESVRFAMTNMSAVDEASYNVGIHNTFTSVQAKEKALVEINLAQSIRNLAQSFMGVELIKGRNPMSNMGLEMTEKGIDTFNIFLKNFKTYPKVRFTVQRRPLLDFGLENAQEKGLVDGSLLWVGNVGLGIAVTWITNSLITHGFSLISLGFFVLMAIPIVASHEIFHILDRDPKAGGWSNRVSWRRGFAVETSLNSLITVPIKHTIIAISGVIILGSLFHWEAARIFVEMGIINLLALIPGSKLSGLPGGKWWRYLWAGSDGDIYFRKAKSFAASETGRFGAANLFGHAAQETFEQTLLYNVRWLPLFGSVGLAFLFLSPLAAITVLPPIIFLGLRIVAVVPMQRMTRPLFIDSLTGLPTLKFLGLNSSNGYLARRFRNTFESNGTMAIMVMDIDNFGDANKYYGTEGADKILRQVSREIDTVVHSYARPLDDVVRYGGEEIYVILYGLDPDPKIARARAAVVAERIREAVYNLGIDLPASKHDERITISIGVALSEPNRPITTDNTLAELKALRTTADHALVMQAKKMTPEGHDHPKNRYAIADSIQEGLPEHSPKPLDPLKEKISRLQGLGELLFFKSWRVAPGEPSWRTAVSALGWAFYFLTLAIMVFKIWNILHGQRAFGVHSALPFLSLFLMVVGDYLVEKIRTWRIGRDQLMDTVTDIPSGRYLQMDAADGRLPRLYKRALGGAFTDRPERPSDLSAIVVEINNFKAVNDKLGHDAGDRVLREVAQTIRDTVRVETVVRFAGKQFLVVLPKTDRSQAEQIAEKIEKAVRKLEITVLVHGEKRRIKASVRTGITDQPSHTLNVKEWLQKAFDEADAARDQQSLEEDPQDELELSWIAQLSARFPRAGGLLWRLMPQQFLNKDFGRRQEATAA